MSIAKEKTKHIAEFHFEHQLWTKEIEFYKDEIVVFNKRLEGLSNMYSNDRILTSLEQFQNQFILQNESADELLHDLELHEQYLADTAKEFPISINRKAFGNHTQMSGRGNSYLKIHRELRNDYMKFNSAGTKLFTARMQTSGIATS